MIRKFRWIALVLAVFMVVSCTSGTPEGRGSVEFRIGGSSGSKTLLPEEIADPDYYSFTLSLRDGSEFSSDTSSNKKDVRFETNDEGKYVVDGIKPGTYSEWNTRKEDPEFRKAMDNLKQRVENLDTILKGEGK